MPEIISRVIDCHVFMLEGGIPHYLVLRRAADVIYAGTWRMVGGKIEPGEKAWETALRELKEETGLSPQVLWSVPFLNSFYESSHDRVNIIPVFAAQVDTDQVLLSGEHDEYQWAQFDKAEELLAWPAQKQGLRIVDEFIANPLPVEGFLRIDI